MTLYQRVVLIPHFVRYWTEWTSSAWSQYSDSTDSSGLGFWHWSSPPAVIDSLTCLIMANWPICWPILSAICLPNGVDCEYLFGTARGAAGDKKADWQKSLQILSQNGNGVFRCTIVYDIEDRSISTATSAQFLWQSAVDFLVQVQLAWFTLTHMYSHAV